MRIAWAEWERQFLFPWGNFRFSVYDKEICRWFVFAKNVFNMAFWCWAGEIVLLKENHVKSDFFHYHFKLQKLDDNYKFTKNFFIVFKLYFETTLMKILFGALLHQLIRINCVILIFTQKIFLLKSSCSRLAWSFLKANKRHEVWDWYQIIAHPMTFPK